MALLIKTTVNSNEFGVIYTDTNVAFIVHCRPMFIFYDLSM